MMRPPAVLPTLLSALLATLSNWASSSGCCRLVAALSSSPSTPTTHTAANPDGVQPWLPSSHRIFVGNLSPRGCDVAVLRDAFCRYGEIRDVTLHGIWEKSPVPESVKKRKKKSKVRPYAFVCFKEPDSAIHAMADFQSSKGPIQQQQAPNDTSKSTGETTTLREGRLFGAVVKNADPIKPRARSLARKKRAREMSELISRFADEASVVILAPKSHLDRLEDYLPRHHDCEVLGRLDPGRRTVGLLLLGTYEPTEVANGLLSSPFASTAVHKLYVVEPGRAVIGGSVGGAPLSMTELAEEALRRLKSLRSECGEEDGHGGSNPAVVRVQAFPPKIRPDLIAAMDGMWDEEELAGVDISPTGFSHTLSVVELEPAKEGKEGAFLMGLTAAMPTDALMTHDRARFLEESNEMGGDNVCRAYYKIEEALTRYDAAAASPMKNRLVGSVALDCGASPGGWTKYLLDEAGCKVVHSVDPGKLSPDVRDLNGARHWKMKVESALPLLGKENVRVDVWTSDMCLHIMSEQVDWLLRAREAGVLRPDAMFILTLKCNTGHSKLSHDYQVEKEVARLKKLATEVEVMHLFSNRNGERTVMGFFT